MSTLQSKALINRRHLLAAGAAVSVMGSGLGPKAANAAESEDGRSAPLSQDTIDDIQAIIQAQGMVSNGVLSIEIDRDDLSDVRKNGIHILPAFQINGALFFQGFSEGRVAMNGDMALKADELDPFIDQLLAHDIIFQAEHQHFYDLSPMVWFIHFRMFGDPLKIAKGVKAALDATSTPFPQSSPINPTTPLPAKELGRILGAAPTIGANGVVSFEVPREEPIRLGG
ncbi:MAG: DUF1259 domain-containing protein, partial [Pseudomonadota bacterium]|nr:DUF1259 domain-containing protein [Pseudomonadota bacterium]